MNEILDKLSNKDRPVFILNKNLLSYPREMFDIISNQNLIPIIIDDNSNNKDTLSWYETIKNHVIFTNTNINRKSRIFWELNISKKIDCEFFAVSDGDLDLKQLPNDWFDVFSYKLKIAPKGIRKIAASIQIDDLISKNEKYDIIDSKEEILLRESAYWLNSFDDLSYIAPTDTTLAVYSKETENYDFYSSLRMKPPYVVRHYPWYLSFNNLEKEIIKYIRTASFVEGSSTFVNRALNKGKKMGLEWALVDLNVNYENF